MNTFSRTKADLLYACLLRRIQNEGQLVETRNHLTKSHISLLPVIFTSAPLVTWRKTAWGKALREMEWFLSGDPKCPEELLDWWQGQLNSKGYLLAGYGHQFRTYIGADGHNNIVGFDQIQFLQKAMISNPASRRMLLTSWHPYDQAYITSINKNPNTPTTCHNTMTQFFVREGKLFMKTFQRSADMLLGVPHNWIQSWAMLVWFAHHAGLQVGHMEWSFGDAHLYQEESHLACVKAILEAYESLEREEEDAAYAPLEIQMTYTPTTKNFCAKDFALQIAQEDLLQPVTSIRPTLL